MGNVLRVLSVIANPSDLPRFDDARVWREISEALEPMRARGSIVLERLAEPTEAALKKSLGSGQWQVLHFVGHGQDRAAARYGTVALQSSDGRARNLTAAYLASLIAGHPAVKRVVLQPCDESSRNFSTVAAALEERGVAVTAAPPLGGAEARVFVARLYAEMLAGMETSAPTPPVVPEAVAPPEEPAPAPPAWQRELERKRAAGQFDVFLCHNWDDKPAVKRIAQRLKEAGILPWLDIWELPPGQPWQAQLEQQIGSIRSAAVLVGAAGMGPWQEQEMYGFLREFARRKLPVIPVLLPDAPSKPDLPLFLGGMTWVDFRADDPDPLELLIWGITGKRPAE